MTASLGATLGIEANSISEESILEFLADKHTLLVFDCLERIVAQTGLIPKILRSATRVQVLATSRILLNAASEREFQLDPFSQRRRKQTSADGLALFVDAAMHADHKFEVTRRNRGQVLKLIEDLEAVPLAIVLAAGRLRHMSLEQLAERVATQRLEVLKRPPISLNDRQADLRRVVGDSLSLLLDDDQALLQILSVFRGGFFERDAQAVLGQPARVQEGIALLRDNSLLLTQIVDNRMRFRILDTVREYLDEKQAETGSGPTMEHRSRHARHFAHLAREVRSQFDSGEYAKAREQIWLDIGNFRVAVTHAVQTKDSELVCTFAQSLARVYFEAGARSEFETLARAGESAATSTDRRLLIELHGLHGELCRREERPQEAVEHWRKRGQLCAAIGEFESEAESYLDIADLAYNLDDLATVREMMRNFEQLENKLPRGPILASGIVILAKMQLREGRANEALDTCAKVEAIMQVVSVSHHALFVWVILAQIYREAGDLRSCARLCLRLLSDALSSGHFQSAGRALLELSEMYEQAKMTTEAAEAIAVALKIPRSVSPTLRQKALARRQAFVRVFGDEVVETAIAASPAIPWERLASQLLEEGNRILAASPKIGDLSHLRNAYEGGSTVPH
jgi:predicted ATPase